MDKKIVAIALMLTLTLMLVLPLANVKAAGIPNTNTITYATIGGPSGTFGTDPAGAYDTSSSTMIQQVYEPLYMYNNMSTDNYEPMLASWWYGYTGNGFTNSSGPLSINDNPTNVAMIKSTYGITVPSWANNTYIFRIRSGVYWQNESYGTVEPSDVVYSIQRVMLLDADTGVQWLLTTPMLGVSSIALFSTTPTKFPAGVNYNGTTGIPGAPGVAGMDGLGNAIETCVEGNNTSMYVAFNLFAPYTPFTQILTQSWAMVTNQKWVTGNGGINTNLPSGYGHEALTNNVYNESEFLAFFSPAESPLMEPSVIDSAYPMMGTGPYIIEHYNPDPNVGYQDYVYNPNYWREWPIIVPTWSEANSQIGPSTITLPTPSYTINPNYNGTNTAQKNAASSTVLGFSPYVVIEVVPTWSTRQFLLLSTSSTQADLADVPMVNVPELSQSGLSVSGPYLPGLSETNVSELEADYLYFCYNVSKTGYQVPLLGSTPTPTLFSDRDLREAIMYLFNESEYLAEAWLGTAIQPTSYICNGILYYNSSVSVRAFNVTEAVNLLKLAWGGAVWSQGITFDLDYNTGNTERELAGDLLQSELELIDTTYHVKITVNVVAVPWAEYMTVMFYPGYPVFIVGWLADYPDPDDWAQPFMLPSYGTYSGLSQAIGLYAVNPVTNAIGYGMNETSLNEAWKTMREPSFGPMPYTSSLASLGKYVTVDAINDTYVSYLISTAPTLPNGPQRQAVYNELMDIFYAEAGGYPLDQPIGKHFERDWINGWIGEYSNNPVAVGDYFAQLWKALPTPTTPTYGININALSSIANTTYVVPEIAQGELVINYSVHATYVNLTGPTVTVEFSLEAINESNGRYYVVDVETFAMTAGHSLTVPIAWDGSTIGLNGTWVVGFEAVPEGSAGAEVYPTNSATLEVNSTYTVRIGNSTMGDLGGGVPPTFGKYDYLCDGKDLALFLECYHGTAPSADLWLSDMGGGVPPTFGIPHAGLPTGKDLALFLEVYHGTAPWQ